MNGLSFEDAKKNLMTWTSATARTLLVGIQRLESLVEELRTELRTELNAVRRERNEAQESYKTACAEREREILAARIARDERDRALVEASRNRKANEDLIRAGNRVLREFERAEVAIPRGPEHAMPLAAFVLEEQARLIVDELLAAKNNPMIRAVERLKQSRDGYARRLDGVRGLIEPVIRGYGIDPPLMAESQVAKLIEYARRVTDELKASRAGRDAEWTILEQKARSLDLANKALERLGESRDTLRDQNRRASAALREALNPAMPADMPLENLARGVVAMIGGYRDVEKRLLAKNAELYEETLRLRNELNAEQAIELVLVDRKGFERKISMRRKDAGPTILVPDPAPLSMRVTDNPPDRFDHRVVAFRFAYGNIYKEQQ